MANTESGNKLNAALRYAGTAGGTLLAIAGAMSLLNQAQITDLKAQIDILNHSIITGYGALVEMWTILGPVGVVVLGYFGVKSSSVKGLAEKLLRIAANAADPASSVAKVAIVNAAASKEVSGEGAVVIAPAVASNPATSENVVASASEVAKK